MSADQQHSEPRLNASPRPTRRAFLGASLATVALGACRWNPTFRVPAAAPATSEPFPTSIALYRQGFENWAKDIAVDNVATCAPVDAQEVLLVANWAARNGYRVRARGAMHTWAPLVISADEPTSNVILVDTQAHLHKIHVQPLGASAIVTAQAGATLEAVLTSLESNGFGFIATPAPGDITIGGALAINGHGTAIPAAGERPPEGGAYGSLSNLVTSLTAVVWDSGTAQFRLKRFARADPRIGPFLTNLGRTFVVEVSLRATRNQRLRCQSITDISWRDLFAAPDSPATGRKVSDYLDAAGRVETIWFPFTESPWLKVWSVARTRPPESREVTTPYNYAFSEIDDATANGLKAAVIADPVQAVVLGALASNAVAVGLAATDSDDIWGWSKNSLLYVRPGTLRYSANGYAILTNRRSVQRILHEFAVFHFKNIERYAQRGLYPANGPVEIRVTGLDQSPRAKTSRVDSVDQPPLLSALRPRPDHPEWDVAIWLDILAFGGTPHANKLFFETERWLLAAQRRWSALVRPEWSKGWGYSLDGPWTSDHFIGSTIPEKFTQGYCRNNDWKATAAAFRGHDPRKVFTDRLLDRLL